MTVGLDATPLIEPTGGIARYTAELSRALAEQFAGDQYWLLSDQDFTHPAPELSNLKHGARPENALDRRWWLWGLQRQIARLQVDLFHGTDFSVPYIPLRPSVLTLHDLAPWLNPAWQPQDGKDRAAKTQARQNPPWHSSSARVRTRTPILLRLGLATMTITPSEAVRKQTIERFGLARERVVAIPEAASALFRRVSVPVPAVPYFLYAGTLEARKNIDLVVECWRAVRQQRCVDLVLAGRARDNFPAPAPQSGLHVLGAVPDTRLPELYSGATAVLYPSFYEGFGLPVLEAMQCGAAVFTSLDPAISETAGGAALQLDIADKKAWVEALIHAVDQPHWIEELRCKSRNRAAAFSWERTALQTREVYVEAQRRFQK